MKRAFLSLYLMLTISILVLGFALDQAWNALHPNSAQQLPIAALAHQFASRLEQLSDQEAQALIASESKPSNTGAGLRYQWIAATSLADGQLKQRLAAGELVSIGGEASTSHYYLAPLKQHILVITQPEKPEFEWAYFAFVLAFYGAIAGVVWFWIWPLARDVVRLGEYVQNYQGDNLPAAPAISSRSIVEPIATTLVSMATRITNLVESHQEMRAAVSHELRTPLARMKFALALIEQEPASETVTAAINQVQDDIQAMEQLINGLLSYAGFEASSQQLKQYSGYAGDFLHEIIELKTRSLSQPLKIHLTDHTGGRMVNCEWQLMRQVIDNLLTNAVRYARTEILVSLEEQEGNWKLSIADDGPGIPESERRKIFQPFYRLPEQQGTSAGFGLGLALVARIMVWHGGGVLCNENERGGAEFVVFWPKS